MWWDILAGIGQFGEFLIVLVGLPVIYMQLRALRKQESQQIWEMTQWIRERMPSHAILYDIYMCLVGGMYKGNGGRGIRMSESEFIFAEDLTDLEDEEQRQQEIHGIMEDYRKRRSSLQSNVMQLNHALADIMLAVETKYVSREVFLSLYGPRLALIHPHFYQDLWSPPLQGTPLEQQSPLSVLILFLGHGGSRELMDEALRRLIKDDPTFWPYNPGPLDIIPPLEIPMPSPQVWERNFVTHQQ